jgi:hypothetical protein
MRQHDKRFTTAATCQISKRLILLIAFCFLASAAHRASSADEFNVEKLPLYIGSQTASDWLIDSAAFKTKLYRTNNSNEIVFSNGLVARTFRLAPNAACVGLDNLMTGQALLRSVRPEGSISINGQPYDIGGLTGQPNHAFLKPEWLDNMSALPNSLQFSGMAVLKCEERMKWKRVRHHAPDTMRPMQSGRQRDCNCEWTMSCPLASQQQSMRPPLDIY